jgi:hypothetical protein
MSPLVSFRRTQKGSYMYTLRPYRLHRYLSFFEQLHRSLSTQTLLCRLYRAHRPTHAWGLKPERDWGHRIEGQRDDSSLTTIMHSRSAVRNRMLQSCVTAGPRAWRFLARARRTQGTMLGSLQERPQTEAAAVGPATPTVSPTNLPYNWLGSLDGFPPICHISASVVYSIRLGTC